MYLENCMCACDTARFQN